MDQIKIFTPASVANVSCGFDVLGFCLDTVGDIMKVSKTENPGVTIGAITGQELPKDPLKNVASVAASSLLEAYVLLLKKKLSPEAELEVVQQVQLELFLLLMNYWGGPIQEMN